MTEPSFENGVRRIDEIAEVMQLQVSASDPSHIRVSEACRAGFSFRDGEGHHRTPEIV